MRDIIHALYDREIDFEPSIKMAAARILQTEGLDQALDFLSAVAEDTPDNERVSVQSFGQLTRQLMYLDRHHEASQIMLLGTELFPDSAQAHRILGDAWQAKGKKEKAIKSWAQALILDPKNEAARSRIKNIEF